MNLIIKRVIKKKSKIICLKYRTDEDSLGKVKIPADAYYGPFTGRAIKQYHVTGKKGPQESH